MVGSHRSPPEVYNLMKSVKSRDVQPFGLGFTKPGLADAQSCLRSRGRVRYIFEKHVGPIEKCVLTEAWLSWTAPRNALRCLSIGGLRGFDTIHDAGSRKNGGGTL